MSHEPLAINNPLIIYQFQFPSIFKFQISDALTESKLAIADHPTNIQMAELYFSDSNLQIVNFEVSKFQI